MATRNSKLLKNKPLKSKKSATVVLTKASAPKAKPGKAKTVAQASRARWAKVFLVLAVVFLNVAIILGLYKLYQRTVLSFEVAPSIVTEHQWRTQPAVSIKIPTANIELPIESSEIIDGIWQVSETGASHLISSAYPGEPSNIVLYGHNRKHLFSNLDVAQLGDTVTLTTADGKMYLYKITAKQIVKPSEIDVVLPTTHEVLTVYTCTGFLDSLRLVITAEPVSVVL